jgi:hypothetical protein
MGGFQGNTSAAWLRVALVFVIAPWGVRRAVWMAVIGGLCMVLWCESG